MHIHHDHVYGGHCHEHNHDGHTHSHEHHHHHDHDHTPMEELVALMQYMVGHNAAHARELAELAHQIAHAGNEDAYGKVMWAVSKFEEGNGILSEVLRELGA